MVKLNSVDYDIGYPIYGAKFLNDKTLLVTGGGGEGNQEISNRLTALTINLTKKKKPIKKFRELKLNDENDAPSVLDSNNSIILLGCNEGQTSIANGHNHNLQKFIYINDHLKYITSTSLESEISKSIYQKFITISKDGSIAAIASSKVPTIIHILDPVNLFEKYEIETNNDVKDLDISPDGKNLTYITKTNTIEIISIITGRSLLRRVDFNENINLNKVRFIDNNHVVLGVSSKNGDGISLIKLSLSSKLKTVKEVQVSKKIKSITSIDVNLQNGVLAISGNENSIILFKLQSLEKIKVFNNVHSLSITKLTFSPNGSFLASVSVANTVNIIEIPNGLGLETHHIYNFFKRSFQLLIVAIVLQLGYLYYQNRSLNTKKLDFSEYFTLNQRSVTTGPTSLSSGLYAEETKAPITTSFIEEADADDEYEDDEEEEITSTELEQTSEPEVVTETTTESLEPIVSTVTEQPEVTTTETNIILETSSSTKVETETETVQETTSTTELSVETTTSTQELKALQPSESTTSSTSTIQGSSETEFATLDHKFKDDAIPPENEIGSITSQVPTSSLTSAPADSTSSSSKKKRKLKRKSLKKKKKRSKTSTSPITSDDESILDLTITESSIKTEESQVTKELPVSTTELSSSSMTTPESLLKEIDSLTSKLASKLNDYASSSSTTDDLPKSIETTAQSIESSTPLSSSSPELKSSEQTKSSSGVAGTSPLESEISTPFEAEVIETPIVESSKEPEEFQSDDVPEPVVELEDAIIPDTAKEAESVLTESQSADVEPVVETVEPQVETEVLDNDPTEEVSSDEDVAIDEVDSSDTEGLSSDEEVVSDAENVSSDEEGYETAGEPSSDDEGYETTQESEITDEAENDDGYETAQESEPLNEVESGDEGFETADELSTTDDDLESSQDAEFDDYRAAVTEFEQVTITKTESKPTDEVIDVSDTLDVESDTEVVETEEELDTEEPLSDSEPESESESESETDALESEESEEATTDEESGDEYESDSEEEAEEDLTTESETEEVETEDEGTGDEGSGDEEAGDEEEDVTEQETDTEAQEDEEEIHTTTTTINVHDEL